MAWLLVLGVIALPVVEIALFVKSAEAIGVLPTVAAAVLAGIAGIALLQRQGLAILLLARQQLARGELPLDAGFDALCLTLAGVLLVLPGFLTDAMAIVLLLPPVRAGLKWWLSRHFRAVVVGRAGPRPTAGAPPVIEADYRVVDGEDKG
jgi:UPF0716 protein FxsA